MSRLPLGAALVDLQQQIDETQRAGVVDYSDKISDCNKEASSCLFLIGTIENRMKEVKEGEPISLSDLEGEIIPVYKKALEVVGTLDQAPLEDIDLAAVSQNVAEKIRNHLTYLKTSRDGESNTLFLFLQQTLQLTDLIAKTNAKTVERFLRSERSPIDAMRRGG